MRSSSRRWLALAVGLLIVSGPVAAHHSSAVFDPNKRVTVTGIITEWFWANPHCLLSLDVKGADGQIVKWAAETQAPPNMIPYGWSRQSFKPGEEVAITMEQARHYVMALAKGDRNAMRAIRESLKQVFG